MREFAEWGGVIFVLALIGTVAYVWRARTEPGEASRTAGGRFRRAVLGVILTGTALLAPAYQAHLHTDISFQKHIGFGLFFAAPIAGLGLARILGDHLRRPHIGVAVWCLALVLGLIWSGQYFQGWPNSDAIRADLLRLPQATCPLPGRGARGPDLLPGDNQDAQPGQFSSTYYLSYRQQKGVTADRPGRRIPSASKDGYFHIVVYYFQVTTPVDGVLAHTLATSHIVLSGRGDRHQRLVRPR